MGGCHCRRDPGDAADDFRQRGRPSQLVAICITSNDDVRSATVRCRPCQRPLPPPTQPRAGMALLWSVGTTNFCATNDPATAASTGRNRSKVNSSVNAAVSLSTAPRFTGRFAMGCSQSIRFHSRKSATIRRSQETSETEWSPRERIPTRSGGVGRSLAGIDKNQLYMANARRLPGRPAGVCANSATLTVGKAACNRDEDVWT